MGALYLVAVLQFLNSVRLIRLTLEAESKCNKAEEAMRSRKPDEALPLLERVLSICDERQTVFSSLPSWGLLVKIRILHARFYATCNPPQPERVREWLDKAEAKCEELRHVKRPFSWVDWIFSIDSQQDWDSYTLRKLADIKLIEGGYEFLGILGNSSSRGGANTRWMTSFEQAAILLKQALEIDLINAENDWGQTGMASLALYKLRDILRASLTGHPPGHLIELKDYKDLTKQVDVGFRNLHNWAASARLVGFAGFQNQPLVTHREALKDSVAPEDYRRFVNDNRDIIERIASICAWAIQSFPNREDTAYNYPDHLRHGAHHNAHFQVKRSEMYGLVGRTFLYLGDSCDNSKAMAGRKREYFERARINLELAVAVMEGFSSSDNSSDAPGWPQSKIKVKQYLRVSMRKDREAYSKLLDQMKLRL
jgi:hypothetical protein